MNKLMLTNGNPVPEDRSHTRDRGDGQQIGYVVLTPEERAKGFVKPVRYSYIHEKCNSVTTMGRALSETYARDPYFYSGTFCCKCGSHFDLDQFHWEDGEPMDPLKQDDWAEEKAAATLASTKQQEAKLEQRERAELTRLKAKYE